MESMMKPRFGKTQVMLLGILAAAWLGPAWGTEVYTWTDEDGTVHFSDSPRPSGPMDVIDVEEAYRPGTEGAYDESGAPPAGETGETVQSAAQQRREKIAQEQADRQNEQAETDRLCGLHRQRLEQMEPARRVFYVNEEGESVRMDDDQRMGLIDESKAFLAANCD
jgi:hypothetical protein